MFKDSRWAREIIDQQMEDGQWGPFHTLSEPRVSKVTTEQALGRLRILGYTIEDPVIRKTVDFMKACLRGEAGISDRREKTHDWDMFTDMMMSTWIRQFTLEDERANGIARKWAGVVAAGVSGGIFSQEDYVKAYKETWGQPAKGDRFIDCCQFYMVSLIRGCLEPKVEAEVFRHFLNHPRGIYYVYGFGLREPPEVFANRPASRYVGALELLSEYENPLCREQLDFVRDWLLAWEKDGTWDFGAMANDKIYFPLSDSWRKREDRIGDSTYRVKRLLSKLEGVYRE